MDISLIAGMPLEQIHIGGTQVADISPLLKCPTLKYVVLPQDAKDVESLRVLPKLTRVSYTAISGGDPDKTAEQFWAEYDRTKKRCLAVAKSDCPASALGALSINLAARASGSNRVDRGTLTILSLTLVQRLGDSQTNVIWDSTGRNQLHCPVG